ncbi:MAG: holin [Solobacterium sp.]|nr:holin [Solobacterium sp.]
MNELFSKEWFKAAGLRALRTVAQTALGMFTVGMAADEVEWSYVASVSVVAGIYSLLTSLAGLPEVGAKDE